MKVYVVIESFEIEGQEYETVQGIFSSKDKAEEAIASCKMRTKEYFGRYTYYYIEREVDQLWEQ